MSTHRPTITGVAQRAGAVAVFALAVPQVYVLPRGTVDVALSTVVILLLVPSITRWAWRHGAAAVLRGVLGYALVALLVVRVLALTWSPDPGAGRAHITLLVQFLATLVLMDHAVRTDPRLLHRLVWAYWPFVLAQVALVLLFRLFPAVEEQFLRGAAGWVAGHNTVSGIFTVNRNNVLDPLKAGGVFVNGNVAGLFLGVSALLAFAVYLRTRQRFVLFTAIVALAAVPVTGSKSGTVLAVALPAAAVVALWLGRSSRAVRRRLLTGAALMAAASLVALGFVEGGFAGALRVAADQRAEIWGFGVEQFGREPLLGLGYGGWDDGFAAYASREGIYRSFPPHNVLIAAWAATGLAGMAATLAVFAGYARVVARARRSGRDPRFVVLTGAALTWLTIQAMGENTDVFGEIHVIPAVALLLALATYRPPVERTECDEQADGRDRPAPAVPAVGDVHPEPGPSVARLPAAVRGAGPDSGERTGRHTHR